MSSYKIYTDGGSRSNPGQAAIGFVIYDMLNKEIYKTGKAIGVATNNVAEYTALLFGVLKLKDLKCTSVEIFMDSELIVKQMQGHYRTKDNNLAKIKQNVLDNLKGVEWNITHIKREKNKIADALVNQALDAL